MKNNWKKVKLSDIAKITMGQSPKSSYYNSVGDGMPFLQGNRTFGSLYPIFDTWTTMITKTAKAGDVIMSVRAPVGELNITPANICLGRGVCSIREKNNNQTFLYYLMKYMKPIIVNKESGTVFGSINSNDINNLEICIPKFKETQQKIAKMLSAFDDKIELNNKINENLEQQAQAVFKEKIINQCNNRNGKIGDYCSVKSGFAFKSTWWQDKGIKVIKIKNINDDNIDIKNCSFVNKDKIPFAKEFVVKGGDLLIAMTGAAIGKFAVVPKTNETLLVNQRVGKFFLGEEPINNLPFLYCTLKEKDITTEIINKGQGSAQANISGNDIMTTDCYFPNRDIIQSFNKICKPLFENIIMNNYENEQLANLRDTLLPKLMNGEIDVENIK